MPVRLHASSREGVLQGVMLPSQRTRAADGTWYGGGRLQFRQPSGCAAESSLGRRPVSSRDRESLRLGNRRTLRCSRLLTVSKRVRVIPSGAGHARALKTDVLLLAQRHVAELREVQPQRIRTHQHRSRSVGEEGEPVLLESPVNLDVRGSRGPLRDASAARAPCKPRHARDACAGSSPRTQRVISAR